MSLARLSAALTACLLGSLSLAQDFSLPPAQRSVLGNGTVLILHRKTDVPLIGLQASIRGGAVTDPAGLDGMASLLAQALEQGAGERDAAGFAEAVESVGGRLAATAERESITVSAEFLARDAQLMVGLLADMLRAPALESHEVRKIRERNIDQLRAAKENNLRALLPVYGNAFLFGDHPYGRPLSGSEASLAGIEAADLRRYYQDYLGGDRLIVSVAGDFDIATLRGMLETAFADWPPARAALPKIEAPEAVTGRRVLLIDKPGAPQSYFWLGNVGVGLGYASRAELDIANTLFGGRFTSMLNDELRTRAGLTYGARSSLRRESVSGSVAVVSDTASATTVEAIDLALSVLGRLRAEGVEDKLVVSGKNYLLGQFTPRFETAAQLAAEFARLEVHGLAKGYIDDYGAAVTAADGATIRKVVDEVFPVPENLVFAIIGDAERIREAISKYGPVTEMSITDPRFTP